jgi:outer membrane protein assembly factor BamB
MIPFSQIHRLKGLLLAFVLSMFFIPIAQAADWPQWRGPDRDGISTESNWSVQWPSEGPPQLWQARVGQGYSSFAVSNGRLYTMGNINENDYVFCFDAATGVEIWKHSYPCSSRDPNGYHGARCTPTVDGNLVFTISREGHLFCLDAQTGQVNWAKNLRKDYRASPPKWGFSGSPLVEGNLLLVETGGRGASMVALDKFTGKEIWRNGSDAAGYSSPVAFSWAGERAVATFSARALVARRIRDGQELWRFPWRTSFDVNAATPIIKGDKAFISSGYNKGAALVDFSGRQPRAVWQSRNMRNHINSSVLYNGYLYGFDENDLKCLEFETGREVWSQRRFGKGSLIVADGKLIVYNDSGRLAVAEASPDGYREISGAQVLGGRSTWVAPVLSNGRIYCRSGETLVCLDVSER